MTALVDGVRTRRGFAIRTAAACAALAMAIWLSTRLHCAPALHHAALLIHLASLVLGFGAVLVVDYFAVAWVLRRTPLREMLTVADRLQLPIWLGVIGLVASGVLLEPNIANHTTQTKMALVVVLTLNGLQASAFTDRVAARDGILDRALIARGTLTLLISQACWWGALWIGFWNTTNRA
ncbi:hypothetical protein AB0L63_20580 [Nocardia sp. NPDC051990]|uniref:hypothetical protein n=1 Tax=Nocardia sp. NPDC051990 TaxID=3155285 RepID=UPI003438CEB4